MSQAGKDGFAAPSGEFETRDGRFGSGFADAPPGWVTVFRECSDDELARVARQGLVVPPPPLRHPEVRQEMETLDRFRPAELAAQGVSRLAALYAAPSPEETPRLPFRQERCILELKVDPARCWVGDMNFITGLIPFLRTRSYHGLRRFHGAFRKYWESVMRLDDFFGSYKKVETADGCHWAPQPTRPGSARVFYAPEIMVLLPLVDRRYIRVYGQGSAGREV